MCKRTIIILFLMVISIATQGKRTERSFFKATLNNNSIYTPGRVILSLQLNDKSVLSGSYRYNILIFAHDMLLKEQSVIIDQKESHQIDMEFEDIRHITHCRCRVELFLENSPLEVKELFLTLYPSPFRPFIHQKNVVIWAYDEAGKLQSKLDELNVNFRNANFQLVRDFNPPDIILIGEDIKSCNMDFLINNYEKQFSRSVWIFLKQKSLASLHIQQKPFLGLQGSMVCDYEESILDGLSCSEIMEIIGRAEYLQVFNNNGNVHNIIGKKHKNESIESLLTSIDNSSHLKIYCQIPLLEEGPVGDIILVNLINYAIAKSR